MATDQTDLKGIRLALQALIDAETTVEVYPYPMTDEPATDVDAQAAEAWVALGQFQATRERQTMGGAAGYWLDTLQLTGGIVVLAAQADGDHQEAAEQAETAAEAILNAVQTALHGDPTISSTVRFAWVSEWSFEQGVDQAGYGSLVTFTVTMEVDIT